MACAGCEATSAALVQHASMDSEAYSHIITAGCVEHRANRSHSSAPWSSEHIYQKCRRYLTVPQEIELVHAVVHALHVLEDVRPGVGRCAKGRHVAGLHSTQITTFSASQETPRDSRRKMARPREGHAHMTTINSRTASIGGQIQRAARQLTGGLGMPTKPRYWSSAVPVVCAEPPYSCSPVPAAHQLP